MKATLSLAMVEGQDAVPQRSFFRIHLPQSKFGWRCANMNHKKRCDLAVSLLILLMAGFGCQTKDAKEKARFARSEAVRLTAPLYLAMTEQAAVGALIKSGLTETTPGKGDNFVWYHSFSMRDHHLLILEISPDMLQPGDRLENGRLKACWLCDKRHQFQAIGLRNKP